MTEPPRKRLKKLRLDEISLVDLGADENATIKVIKRGAAPQGGHDMTDQEKILEQMTAATVKITEQAAQIEAITKQLKVVEGERDVAKRAQQIAEATAKSGEDGEDAILKAADPLVAAEIIKLRKANIAAAKQLAEIADGEEVKKAIAQVKADFSELPIKAEEFGPVMKRAMGLLPAEDITVLNRVLKAANGAMQDAMRLGGGRVLIRKGNAESEIERKAQEVAKAESIPFAKAYDTVLEREPALYTRFLEERAASMN